MTKGGWLSKSQVLMGLRCHKYLWWLVHEPGAPELKPDEMLRDRFDQGREVGTLAREYVPGGELIGSPFIQMQERIELTQHAVKRGVPVLYEAALESDGVAVLVDILERTPDGFTVIEVKASSSVQRKHIPDVGLQVHVARRAGLSVARAEVMRLNPDCRYPHLSDLFIREDVTGKVEKVLPVFSPAIRVETEVVRSGLPDVPIGAQCTTPDDCPFMARCWPPLPQYHVSTLHNVRQKKITKLTEMGVTTISAIPDDFELGEINARQRRAVREGQVVVEPSLSTALGHIREPLAFLDFETVSRAIPIWHGCRPWEQVPAQFSCHKRQEDGLIEHHEWLVQGRGDPRRELAQRLIEACKHASVVLAYNAGFERGCILGLMEAFPDLRTELRAVVERLVDLLPIVRDKVYDPAFDGSFSLKAVAPVLVPDLSYGDLAIASGGDATIQLARLALTTDLVDERERTELGRQLLEYCKRDTWCLVRLLDRLRELAAGGS